MRVLGIHSFTHDSSAAVVADGRLLAFTEEERLSRRKGDKSFSALAISACLKESGLSPSQIDAVVLPFRPRVGSFRRLAYLARRPGTFIERAAYLIAKGTRILGVEQGLAEVGIRAPASWEDHYLCHAMAVFCASPFDRSSVLVLDGVAEAWSGSMFEAIRDPFPRMREITRLDFPHSLGLVYAAVTEHLGFRHNREEGKVMSMAALGDDRFHAAFGRICRVGDRKLSVDQSYFDFAGSWTTGAFAREFCPPRRAGEDFLPEHFALASALQRAVETASLILARCLMAETGCKDLCFTGGLALNPALNGALAARSGCRDLFVFPAGGDAGTALGAALLPKADPSWRLDHAFWGRGWNEWLTRAALTSRGLNASCEGEAAIEMAADLLSRGAVGAVFQGRSEMGPRALGHRSILADPRRPGIKERLNSRIKRREPFQPFAPAVLSKACETLFPGGKDSPFMLKTVTVPIFQREMFPAVLHADGTARVQAVEEGDGSGLVQILKAFEKRAGIPVLLNTSLNRRGEPLADSPDDAIAIFLDAGLNFLLIGGSIVLNPEAR